MLQASIAFTTVRLILNVVAFLWADSLEDKTMALIPNNRTSASSTLLLALYLQDLLPVRSIYFHIHEDEEGE